MLAMHDVSFSAVQLWVSQVDSHAAMTGVDAMHMPATHATP